jgi:hypothetical protein
MCGASYYMVACNFCVGLVNWNGGSTIFYLIKVSGFVH